MSNIKKEIPNSKFHFSLKDGLSKPKRKYPKFHDSETKDI